MSLAHWQTIIERINQTHGTQFGSDEVVPMLKYLVEKLGTHRKASEEVGVTRATVSFRIRHIDMKPKPRAVRAIPKPAVAPIDMAAWRRSGMAKSPCAMCPIGRGTKNRPECDECEARYEYAMISADLPSRRCVDLFRESEHARTRRASACI